MQSAINDLITFHQTFGAPVLPSPSIPPKERQALRRNLVHSEAEEEFTEAWSNCQLCEERLTNAREALRTNTSTSNTIRQELERLVSHWTEKSDEALAELGDAIADSIYVLIGTALEYGLPLEAIWNEVQRSNMAKLWTWSEVVTFGDDPDQRDVSPDDSGTILIPDSQDKWTYAKVGAIQSARCYTVKNQLGKVQKPPSWTPPNLLSIIKGARSSVEDIRAKA